MQKKRVIRMILGWALAVAIIFYLIRLIYINRTELQNWDWDINWWYAFLSACCLGIAYICASQAWRIVISGFGFKMEFHQAFRVTYLANLGRYIPGKVWQVFGMVGLARELGIPAKVSLASFALNQAYALPAAFLLIPLTLGNLQSIASLSVYRDIFYIFCTLMLIVFLFFFLTPNGLNRLLNQLLRIFGQERVNYDPRLIDRVSVFVLYMMNWLFFGIAFHFFLIALHSEKILTVHYAIGSYITAYVLGYISFISPGGLGFREGIMTAVLSPFFGPAIAAGISMINRLWITAAEVVISLISLATYRFGRGRKMQSPA